MQVKGTAFLAREKAIIAAFGAERWKTFLDAVAETEPFFKRHVSALTWIPIEPFLLLHDRLLAEFFQGDQKAFWTMGEKSAEWALTEGPYAIYVRNRNIEAFVRETLSSIWPAYYSKGKLLGAIDGKCIDVRIQELPVVHPYFELLVMGYSQRAFELVGGKVESQKVKSARNPGDEIHYRFRVV